MAKKRNEADAGKPRGDRIDVRLDPYLKAQLEELAELEPMRPSVRSYVAWIIAQHVPPRLADLKREQGKPTTPTEDLVRAREMMSEAFALALKTASATERAISADTKK